MTCGRPGGVADKLAMREPIVQRTEEVHSLAGGKYRVSYGRSYGMRSINPGTAR